MHGTACSINLMSVVFRSLARVTVSHEHTDESALEVFRQSEQGKHHTDEKVTNSSPELIPEFHFQVKRSLGHGSPNSHQPDHHIGILMTEAYTPLVQRHHDSAFLFVL